MQQWTFWTQNEKKYPIHTPGHIPKDSTSNHERIYISMFAVALFTTRNKISLYNHQQMNGKGKYIKYIKGILLSHKEKNEMWEKYMELENMLTIVI